MTFSSFMQQSTDQKEKQSLQQRMDWRKLARKSSWRRRRSARKWKSKGCGKDEMVEA